MDKIKTGWGGIKSREETNETCCSVWSHVSFTLLSVCLAHLEYLNVFLKIKNCEYL